MLDFVDIGEIAKLHDTEVSAVRFPDNPQKPRRENYNSHADYGKALDEYELLVTQHRVDVKLLQQKIYEIDARYEEMAFEYLDIKDHPKRGIAWRMAWEDRHSEGFCAVLNRLEYLTELM